LIVESFQELDNAMGPTFGKRLKILEVMAAVKSFDIMLDLECNDLILHMFQCFFNIVGHLILNGLVWKLNRLSSPRDLGM